MKTSPPGVAFIAAHEGVVTRAYRDVAGVLTIGVGHTAAAGAPLPKPGMTISREEALQLLATDLPAYEDGVKGVLGPVAPAVFDGAVSFHFNTGAIARATWVGKYREGAFAAAETSLKSWKKSGGKIYKGLIRRRAEEADLIFRARYPAGLSTEGYVIPADPAEIASLQKALAELGYIDRADPATGEAMIAAVRRFQADHGLVVDGIVGPATRATLERAMAAKRAASVTIGAGGAGATAGGIDAGSNPVTSAPAVIGDVVLTAIGWAMAAMVLVGLGFAAWQYRGAIGLRLKRLLRRKTP